MGQFTPDAQAHYNLLSEYTTSYRYTGTVRARTLTTRVWYGIVYTTGSIDSVVFTTGLADFL
jgi:hypothetical protein